MTSPMWQLILAKPCLLCNEREKKCSPLKEDQLTYVNLTQKTQVSHLENAVRRTCSLLLIGL